MKIFDTGSFIGCGPSEYPVTTHLASTDEGGISFDSAVAPKSLHRRSDGPWTPHELPRCDDQGPTSASARDRGSRLGQALRYDNLPRGQFVGGVLQAGYSFGSKPPTRSGLTSLFEDQPEPPTVIVDVEETLSNPPSIEQQCPLFGESSYFDHYYHSPNALGPMNSSFTLDAPPSAFSTDDEDVLEEASVSSYSAKDLSSHLHNDARDVLQIRHEPSSEYADWSFPENDNYDKRFLSPIDLRTRPEAIPANPLHDQSRPSIAYSYPLATSDHTHLGRMTTDAPIAPRSNTTVTEGTMPPKRSSSEVNILAIVREDGRGGALLPPSAPKKGRRITG